MAAFHTVPLALGGGGLPGRDPDGGCFRGAGDGLQRDPGDRPVLRRALPLRRRPAFLFSGTFFPVTQLPGWLQVVARCTPLYQGVSLCRDLVLGRLGGFDASATSPTCLAMLVGGVLAARITYRRRLVQ